MTNIVINQVYSPPELPQYLKDVCDLRPIVGTPTDDELIGIHSVIQVASKAADIRGLGDSLLLARLSEHLFSAQMARYRVTYLDVVLPENATYTPPNLPSHVSVHLETVTGIPSEEDIIKVQEAVRSYQHFSNVPSMFNAGTNVELLQHLFDMQMAIYTEKARQNCSVLQATPSPIAIGTTVHLADTSNTATNNPGTGANTTQIASPEQVAQDVGICDVIGRSNRLAEQANELTERANILIQRSNELMERPSMPVEQNQLLERFTGTLERISEHFERSNSIAEGLIKPTEAIADVLCTINRVLVRIQHAIIRSHKGNTTTAFDCLINEKGEVPALSPVTDRSSFAHVSKDVQSSIQSVDPIINGVTEVFRIHDQWLGRYLRFYGVGEELFEDNQGGCLKKGKEGLARLRLRQYLSSCLG